MKEFACTTITDPEEFSASCAALLMKEAVKFNSDITLVKDGSEGGAKIIFVVLGLAVGKGAKLILRICGPDGVRALLTMKKILRKSYRITQKQQFLCAFISFSTS